MRKKLLTYSMLLAVPFLMANDGGCQAESTSDQTQRRQQEELNERSNMAAGMPTITHFSEKKLMKTILELRDQMPRTWTYFYDMHGHVGDKLCDSVGYGLPYSTQFTNPEKMAGYHPITLPQADPNALFSPANADATWVLCKDPTPGSDKVLPLYVEPRIITSPFPLKKD